MTDDATTVEVPAGWKRYWKAIIAVLGGVVVVLNAFLGAQVFGPEAQKWVAVGVSALTALLVYMKKNADPDPPPPEPDPPGKRAARYAMLEPEDVELPTKDPHGGPGPSV